MRRFILAFMITICGLTFANQATAGIWDYTFTFSDGTNTANGGLDVTPYMGPGLFATSGYVDVTSGLAIGHYSLEPLGPGEVLTPSGLFFVDNVIYPMLGPATLLDVWGLIFTNGTTEINIWGNGGTQAYQFYSGANGGYPVEGAPNGTFLFAVPEPSTLALLGLGGICLAVGAIRRRNLSVI